MQITTLPKDDVKRGEIYYISRGGYNTGSEQQADRPGVIVSNDKNNKNSQTLEVVYLTTQPKNEQEKEKNEETFVKKVVQTALEAERQIRRQQVLHNTRMLMEEYIEMKRHIESAVSEEDELKEEQYDVFRGEGAHLGSVRRSKMKTAMMIANIDRAMEELRAEYEMKEMVYKYDAFKMHYIDGVSYEEIADIQNCGKNTPSRWSKELIRKMSVKLFGIDGVEKY